MQSDPRMARPHRNARLPALALVGTLLLGVSLEAAAQFSPRPRQNSTLYYRLGGGDPAKRANNTGAVALQFGLGGNLKLNYSCGRFDLGLSWGNLMNSFANFGTTVTNAVKAGIASLPLYILQRAQPGLYQLFQTYSAKADTLIAASLKTCEEMEQMIKDGRDPYAEWANSAKSITWKAEAKAGNTDLIEVKKEVGQKPGIGGVPWIRGGVAGGQNQPALKTVADTVAAGYNVTLNVSPHALGNIDYSGSPLAQQALVKAFKKAEDAAKYAADVLGEKEVATCDEPGCPNKGTSTAVGLSPKYEAEIPEIRKAMNKLLVQPIPEAPDLEAVGAPGVLVSRDLIDALRELPDLERGIVAERLIREVALARTIDKALAIRNVYLVGSTLPEVEASPANKEIPEKLEALNKYIEDLVFEGKVRKELLSNTASIVLDAYRGARSASSGLEQQGNRDPSPVKGGAVRP